MKTIEIDDDLYAYLLTQVCAFHETPSALLRRLLKVPSSRQRDAALVAERPRSITEPAASAYRAGTALERFLTALSELATQHGERFRSVLRLTGRRRVYFAEDRRTLEEFGHSVDPKQIPETHFWVVCNNDTPTKKKMLAEVLRTLEVPLPERRAWLDRI
jgi:negative modulator of initiation of replication